MNTFKQLFFVIIIALTFSFPLNGWSQNGLDFQKMKAMFEKRRPQLDTIPFTPEKFKLP